MPIGHNSVAAPHLRAFVERIERLEEEIKALNGDKRDVYAEAKGVGFDVPTIKRLLRRRAKDGAQIQEEDALLDLYERAMEEAPGGNQSS